MSNVLVSRALLIPLICLLNTSTVSDAELNAIINSCIATTDVMVIWLRDRFYIVYSKGKILCRSDILVDWMGFTCMD